MSVNKHSYPDTEISTTGPCFYQMQLVANELDGTLEPTKEFEDSFTDPLNDTTTGTRYKNCRSDGTSLGINFQLERGNAGYVFDGIDTGTQTVPITFRGQPIYHRSIVYDSQGLVKWVPKLLTVIEIMNDL